MASVRCCPAINAMHTNHGHGNPELANLPRKLNIGLSNSRDDFPHTHINDVGLKAVKHPDSGEVPASRETYSFLAHLPAYMHAMLLNKS